MNQPAQKVETTPLEERLLDLIRARGAISVADYMSDALSHPHDGYYMTANPFGGSGDFITAPEVSQIFGELIGLWLVQSWTDMGSPKEFNLVEIGPGRGVLMEDILRAAKLRPDFLNAAQIWLVETSGRLRHEQQRRLRDVHGAIKWADDLTDVTPGPMLLVANELFDCLPIQQFIRTSTGWRERLVGIGEDGKSLAFTHATTPPDPGFIAPPEASDELDQIFEIGKEREALCADIAAGLVQYSGRALIIDYGHILSGLGDTLQAVRDHKYWPVLSAPGKADITSHVDFEALTGAAIDADAGVYGPISQGAFLDKLGLALRVERLSKNTSAEMTAEIHAGAHRLAAPSQMGEVFKAMCISSPDLPPPAAFEDA